MPAVQIRPGIYWVGSDDRSVSLFEGLWPIDDVGVSYNAYVINDEKKVLVDLTEDTKPEELLQQIRGIFDPRLLDYIVINHMEPDHTGALQAVRRAAPNATILASKKAVGMLASYYQITEGARAVEDGETLSLGEHTLQFLSTPFLHWPETMMTLETSRRVLFSCDAFGGFGTLDGRIFTDERDDLRAYEREALRYYVNIVCLYPKPVLSALQRLQGVPVEVIAPSHGRVWRKNPGQVVEWYRRWAGYAQGPQENGITLLYGTMHGNTGRMADAVIAGVERAGVPLVAFDVRSAHPSYILPALYTQKGVLVGAATYEGGLFPPMKAVLDWAEHKRMLRRQSAYFGSCGWGGGARREFTRLAEAMQWSVADSWELSGGPSPEALKYGEEFGYRFACSLRD